MLPAPKRGEIVRRMGNAFRAKEQELGALVTMEMGKIHPEGVGEVIECIDIADFAVGLSRQLYGLTIHSERPQHRMYEQWHPVGTIGIITAFNFPVAVWAWNAMLAAVCGDAMIWKPSLVTPLCAIAMTNVAHEVMREQDIFRPEGCDPCDLFGLIIGTDDEVGETMIADRRLPLISATGSCRMGRHVGTQVAKRLGRCLLELGGNNAIIITENADLDLVIRGTLFGAVGTAGQRCTSTRRLFCHSSVVDTVANGLAKAYEQVSIGNPMDASTLVGPLIGDHAVDAMRQAIEAATEQGCTVLTGGLEGIDRFADDPGHYVTPTIVRVPRAAIRRSPRMKRSPHCSTSTSTTTSKTRSLSRTAWTRDSPAPSSPIRSAARSDSSPMPVPTAASPTSTSVPAGEIGGAFGGEKDTGGGRESGSDS